jgi:hypothetical protein
VKKEFVTPTLFPVDPPGLTVPNELDFESFTPENQGHIIGELIDIRQTLNSILYKQKAHSFIKQSVLPSEFDRGLFKLNCVLEILKANS